MSNKISRIRLSLLIAIISTLFITSCSRKTYPVSSPSHVILELEIVNKKYEHLTLFIEIKSPAGYYYGLEIPGVFNKENEYKWVFIIPDSINKVVEGYDIRIQPFNFEKNECKKLSFSADKISDRKSTAFIIKDKIMSLKGRYTFQDTISYKGLGYLLVDTFVMSPTIVYDVIDIELTNKPYKSDLEVALAYPYFNNVDSYTFNERLKIIKEYPHSYYLLYAIRYLTTGMNKQSLNLLFESFSNEISSTQYGKDVFDHINTEITPVLIDTLSLVNAKDNIAEAVIRTYSKYTLIIFSASWCSPCHEQIPLLKEVFNDCKDSLDMVYISADRKEEETNWNKMIEKEQIPWRSLFARNYRKGLYKSYAIQGIPYSLLVHPSGKIEAIDVRRKKDKERLYKLMGNCLFY